MSIYIKGMEMPSSCEICPFVDDDFLEDYFGLCCSLTKERPHGNERLNSCPLIELPPHGDLVDRALLSTFYYKGTEGLPDDFDHGVLFTLEAVDKLPVVIPEEDEE